MHHITVEPFTSAVLVANVDDVSSLCGIHEEPTLLARGRATVSAVSGQEAHSCRRRSENVREQLCGTTREQDEKRLLELILETGCLS